jgi:glycosyltransferase involved in cell wall biosynthesis
MNILFVHQSFPGQYQHVIKELAAAGHQCIGLGIQPFEPPTDWPATVHYLRYRLQRSNAADIHPLALETESKLIRAEACAEAAHQLKAKGFKPDLICAHPGWGEAMLLPTVWPNVPLLCYQEFFYNETGFDMNFDLELQGERSWQQQAKLVMKNAYLHVTLNQASWNHCPTQFQRSSFPPHWQPYISVIHDGINTHIAKPNPDVAPYPLSNGTVLDSSQPIITFVNRRLEPYRGCHTFLRAIPEIQRHNPEAQIVIIGDTQGVSYGAVCTSGEWKDLFLAEIEGEYDPATVHFLGKVAYASYLQLLQLSSCHVYLTYPFVLSWSLLEAMSTGCAIVGSNTAPVQEIIQDGHNGLLVDFFEPHDVAEAVSELLKKRERAAALAAQARRTIEQHYSLDQCIPKQLALMELVASGALRR